MHSCSVVLFTFVFFFFSSRRRHTRYWRDWSSDVCSSDLVETIFFGGGTPSLMEPATAGAVVGRVKALWDTAAELEITLEANPTSVEAGRFAALTETGVNRVSLGVQAFDPAALGFLGREHSVDEAVAAIDIARRHFARYSFDLIYARPGQTAEAWAGELDQAL